MVEPARTPGRRSGRKTIVSLIVFFTALTVLFTYPISRAPNTYLKDLADSRLVTWILAWNAHALATDPSRIFDANIYFPSEGALAWSETFLAPSLVVAPLNGAGYPVLAYNLVLLSSFVLAGLGATLWVRHMTGSLAAGIVSGVIWAFAPGKFAHIAHLHMMVGQWIPFALLSCSRYIESGRRRDLYVTAGLVALQLGFSLHYGVFLLPLLAIYAVALLCWLPTSVVRESLGGLRRDRAVAAVALAALGLGAVLLLVSVNPGVALERGYEELLRYSARPGSFLSGSPFNQAPHARWLHDRFEVVEANYFPGALPFVLLGGALFGLLPATLHRARQSARRCYAGPAAWHDKPGDRRRSMARSWVSGAGAIIFAGAFTLHVAGLFAARQGGGEWATRVTSLCVTLHPALWAAIGATLALLAAPRSWSRQLPRRGAYLIVLGYLTLLTYLLAYGPEVQAFDTPLGRGPYWFLYRFVPPFQVIRAPGRIGSLWILCVAALAGFVVAYLERIARFRKRPLSEDPRVVWKAGDRAWRIVAVAFMAVLVWEYRVWPLPHERADPAADPADVWLAQQPGDFAVVHAPIGTGRNAWTETAYMLGSTLHWKRLVNGYARSAPPGYLYLTATPPLGTEFFRRLRAGFTVRYLLVHEDRLADDEQRAELRRLLLPNRDAAFIAQFGYTFVFDVPGVGDDRVPPDDGPELPYQFDVRREYALDDLAGSRGIELRVRGSQLAASDEVIVLAGWGEQREVIAISDTWRDVRVELPEGYVDSLGGGPGAFELRAHTLVPIGDTGGSVATGFTIDAQRQGVVVGLGDHVFHEFGEPALVAHRLEDFGKGVVETRTFPPTSAGAVALRTYLEALPAEALVAASVRLEPARMLDADARAAFRLIGAAPPVDAEVSMMVILGLRGADPGTALQDVRHDHAFVDIEGPSPAFQVQQMRLF